MVCSGEATPYQRGPTMSWSIGTKRAPATIKVACFDKDGAPADTRFVLAWSR